MGEPQFALRSSLKPVLAELHIRSNTDAIMAFSGKLASAVTFRHNLFHHGKERLRSCG
jgi:hypothetical protein